MELLITAIGSELPKQSLQVINWHWIQRKPEREGRGLVGKSVSAWMINGECAVVEMNRTAGNS